MKPIPLWAAVLWTAALIADDGAVLLHAIQLNPDEDTPRLVYADYLEEQKDLERARYIRIEVEVARLSGDDPRRKSLTDEADALLAKHEAEWLPGEFNSARKASKIRHIKWSRGFLDEVELDSDALADPLVQKGVDSLKVVRKLSIHFPESLSSGAQSRGEREEMAAELVALSRYAVLESLPSLETHDAVANRDLLAVLSATHRLRELRLVFCDISPSFVVALSNHAVARHLKSLSIDIPVGKRGQRTRQGRADLGPTILESVGNSRKFPLLEHLGLRELKLTDLSALQDGEGLPSLRSIRLVDCGLSERALKEFIASPGFQRLHRFSLENETDRVNLPRILAAIARVAHQLDEVAIEGEHPTELKKQLEANRTARACRALVDTLAGAYI